MPLTSATQISPLTSAVGPPQYYILCISHPPHRSYDTKSRVHPTSIALPPLVWAGIPIMESSLTPTLFISYYGSLQTPPVTPITRLRLKSCYRSVRKPAHACESCISGLPQRGGISQRTCHIAAQSGQYDAAMLPSRGRAGYIHPSSCL